MKLVLKKKRDLEASLCFPLYVAHCMTGLCVATNGPWIVRREANKGLEDTKQARKKGWGTCQNDDENLLLLSPSP